jgi:hypothetical protein
LTYSLVAFHPPKPPCVAGRVSKGVVLYPRLRPFSCVKCHGIDLVGLKQTQPPGATSTWAVVILRGKEVDRLGTVEAPDQREAYLLAIEKFNVPVERQNRLFVRRLRSA